MTRYLSRLLLNPFFAPALRFASEPYEIHRSLLATLRCSSLREKVADQPKTSELLFRVDASDEGPVILLQTATHPDWDRLKLAPRALRCPPETKAYAPTFSDGDLLAFRLFAKPTYRKSGDFGQREDGKRKAGPRLMCRDDEQRIEWLRRKGGLHGFIIASVGLTLFPVKVIKPQEGQKEDFTAVRYDGELIVKDAPLFRDAVENGIGTQKAFGFGLLSVARLEQPCRKEGE